MNSNIACNRRLAVLAVALTFATPSAFAKKVSPPDHATELLARYGTLNVKSAGPYVEIGSFSIEVTVTLGRPAAVLPDGTSLYPGYHVDDSDASGTLVVRFSGGRVISLSLVTPAVAMAMMKSTPPPAKMLAGGHQ